MSESEDKFDSEQQEENPPPQVTPELFKAWRTPRLGGSNPEVMTNPVWEWLIRSKLNAYSANEKFDLPSAIYAGPGWCFDRFGQSSTLLADGRTVLIAGEHEDYYDPDFYIYNDVVVLHPSGRVEIFGYPKDVFPPTDFHTATLVGEEIIIIGNLGYLEELKHAITPIFVLNLGNFTISQVNHTGNAPGWIHKHSATLSEDASSILISGGELQYNDEGQSLVENIDDWRLHLADWRWERLTEKKWQRWEIKRRDGKPNHVWEIEQATWAQSFKWEKEFKEQMEQLTQKLGVQPRLDLAANLYHPGVQHEQLPKVEDEFGVKRIKVDGVVVRYVEKRHHIQVTVEGILPQPTIDALVADLVEKLTILENALCDAKQF